MKMILASLLFAACLGFAGNASAAVQEFGPDFARFTVDVPAEWTATAVENGAQFVKNDKSCSVTVIVAKNEGGANAEAIGKAVAEQAGMKDAKEVDKADSSYTCLGTIGGVQTMIVTMVEDGKFVVSSVSGQDLKASSAILDTLKDK